MKLGATARDGCDVAVGRSFLDALEKVDPDMAVNIDNEEQELDQLEGLHYAAATPVEASGRPQLSTLPGGK